MAVAESILFSRLTGRIGDIRYWNNQYHSIIAGQLTVGVQPDTIDQIRWRTAFGNSVTLWQTIPQSYRDGWLEYSKSILPHRRGYRISQTGFSAFLQVMVKAWYARSRGWIVIDPLGTPPVEPGYISCPAVVSGSLAVGSTGFRYQGRHANSETCIILYNRSAEFPPTRNRFKSPWQITQNRIRTSAQLIIMDKTGMTAGNVGFLRYRLLTVADPFRVSMTAFVRGVAIAY